MCVHVCVKYYCIYQYSYPVLAVFSFSLQPLLLVSVRSLLVATTLSFHALVSYKAYCSVYAHTSCCCNIHVATKFSAVVFASDAQPSLAQLQLLKTADGKKIRIISRLAPHWNDLGDLMNFDQTGSEIETIEQKYRGDPKDCCRAIFKHWLDGNGVIPCSWHGLIELLDDLDQEVLAQEIQSALSTSAK